MAGIVLYTQLRKKVDHSSRAVADNELKTNHVLMCATSGVREVLLYRRQDPFLKIFANISFEGQSPRIFTNIAPSLPSWILEATVFFIVVIAILFMARVQHADIPRITAVLALLLLTAWRVLPYCNRIVSLQIAIRGLFPPAGTLLSLLEKLRNMPSNIEVTPDPNFSFQRDI